MTLRILHASGEAPVPEGLSALATIRATGKSDYKMWTLPLRSLGGATQEETWYVSDDSAVQATSREINGGCMECRVSDDYAMVWLQLDPAGFADFQAVTEFAWQQVLESMQDYHPQLLKVWHYLPGINEGCDDQEQYRQFCVGRAQALDALRCHQILPAATAIGIPDHKAPLVMYWLLGREKGRNIENPRQVSAWKYPRQYGPASPNFSRATLDELSRVLLISGTASVVGHATSHPYQTDKQTAEMLQNLEALLTAVDALTPEKCDLQLRVYLRDVSDWPMVGAELERAGFPVSQLLPLQGDICRSDLMVELDGYGFRT